MTDEAVGNASRPCPLCSNRLIEPLHEGRFVLPSGHPLDPIVRVVACRKCGFCFNDTPCTREDYDRYYREISKYADPRLSSGAGGSAEDKQRLDETAKQVKEFAGEAEGAILDIGCGGGGLIDSLAAYGWRTLVGMDPALACAAEVCRRGHRGVVGTLDDHPLGAERGFDGVILCHVLEHVRDIAAALAVISRLVNRGGWLYVEVPDAARYGDCLIAPFQDFNLEHINHFSAASLRSLLQSYGWKVVAEGAKTLPLANGRKYPAVFAFARPANPSVAAANSSTRDALVSYVEQSAAAMESIKRIISAQVFGKRVAVWGAGQLTMRLLGETALGDADIVAFVDSNPVHHGRCLAGRAIRPPADLRRHLAPNDPIVIGSLVNLESIEASIRDHGLANPLIRLDSAGAA